jgi:hypothetical protein
LTGIILILFSADWSFWVYFLLFCSIFLMVKKNSHFAEVLLPKETVILKNF